jgi:hypothetical protein
VYVRFSQRGCGENFTGELQIAAPFHDPFFSFTGCSPFSGQESRYKTVIPMLIRGTNMGEACPMPRNPAIAGGTS